MGDLTFSLYFCLNFGLHRAKMYTVGGCDPSSLTHSKICTNSSPASFNLLIVNEQALPFKAQNRTNSYISSSPLSGLSARNFAPNPPNRALVPLPIWNLNSSHWNQTLDCSAGRYYWFQILSRDIIKGPVGQLVSEVDVAVKLVNDQNFDVAVKLVNDQNFNLLQMTRNPPGFKWSVPTTLPKVLANVFNKELRLVRPGDYQSSQQKLYSLQDNVL